MAELNPQPIELETRTFTVVQLLDEVRRGRVRLPSFQRRFRWSDEDRRQLFDSLQHGYPVGTLLLARGAAPAGQVALAGFFQQVPAAPDVLWVVDGQQRLATLAMAMVEDHSGGYRPIYFDINTDKFILGLRRRAPAPEWIPARVLLSSAALNRWLREANLSDALNDRADQIAARLREYKVPAYLVPYDGQNDAVLQQIFARTNRSGHALERFEVFEALNVSVRGEEAGPIARMRANLLLLGFGDLEGADIERTTLAIAGATPSQHLDELLKAGKLNTVQLSREVTEGLSRAVAFLREDAGIPHSALLPYSGVLFTLARFFALHPTPHPRNRDLLTRWLWRGMLSRDHRTDNAIDGRKWRAIDSDEHGSVQRLLRLLPPLTEAEVQTQHGSFRRSTARTRIELVALADLDPLLLNGEEEGAPVPLASLFNEDLAETLTPFIKLPDSERSLAEILLHPRITPELLCEASPILLRSHGIDEAALTALRQGDTAGFLRLRGELLKDHVARFLRERAALNPPDRDRAPLDAYFAEEGP